MLSPKLVEEAISIKAMNKMKVALDSSFKNPKSAVKITLDGNYRADRATIRLASYVMPSFIISCAISTFTSFIRNLRVGPR